MAQTSAAFKILISVQKVFERTPAASQSATQTTSQNETSVASEPPKPKQFGRESQDFFEKLEFEQLKRALKLTPTLDTIFAMIKLINFNSEHPENRNVRLDPSDDDHVKIFRRGQWRTEDTRDALLRMTSFL